MYKMITVCTNCGKEFEEEIDIENFDEKVENCHTDFLCFPFKPEWNRYHKCIGGNIGMKVFKCFKQV